MALCRTLPPMEMPDGGLNSDPISDVPFVQFEYGDEDYEINAAEEELTIFVTSDSGAVAHVTPAETVPKGATIDATAINGNFVATNRTRIKNYGETAVQLGSGCRSLSSNFRLRTQTARYIAQARHVMRAMMCCTWLRVRL